MDGEQVNRELPVYPMAALFPMLPEDELLELAEDILTNGLIHPIMLDTAGEYLVDGRNRLRACEIAGVEPRFDRLAADVDPDAYIASVNLARRHMSVGQRAMAMAMIYPEAKRGMHSQLTQSTGKPFDPANLTRARAVLRVAPDDLAPLVLSGARTLNDAYAEIRRRQQLWQSEETQLVRLRTEAPDVAALVVDGSITLVAGIAELDERDRLKRHTIEQGQRAAEAIATNLAANVDSIIGAVELGEPLRFNSEQKDIIRKAIKLLETRGLLK